MTRRIAILVTGSRHWTDRATVGSALLEWLPEHGPPVVLLLHGDAPGLDQMAGAAAIKLGWNVLALPAPWARFGRAAGPLRNRLLVLVLRCLRLCGYECYVWAFPLPGSRGTHQCARVAKRAGFQVRWFVEEPRDVQ